jgi:hypothetical protein
VSAGPAAPGPGRRRATPASAPRAGGWRGVVAPVILLACVAGLLAWATQRAPEVPRPVPAAREVPLDDLTLLCRGVGGAGDAEAAIAVGLLPEASTSGSVQVGDREADTSTAGSWTVRALDDPAAAVPVTARGDVAGAIGAWRAGVADGEGGRGLALGRCARPGTDAWFLGAGSSIDHASTVVVTNAGRTPAVFDVTLLTGDGEVAPVSTQGVALPPGEEQVIDLASVVAGSGDVSVRVRASEGQVAASVLDRWTRDLAPAGTEWVPVAAAADTSLSLTGVAERTERELVVANPGDRTAVVDVEVVGPDATFAAESLTQLEVAAGSSTTVELPRGLGRAALGLRLESDRPVLAAVRARTDGRRPDVAYTVSTPPLDGPTAVPVQLGAPEDGIVPRLALATTDREGTATLTLEAYDADGEQLATAGIDVPAGVTASVDPAAELELGNLELGAVAYLVLTPDGGSPVQAAATYSTDSGQLSTVPVTTPPTTVVAPAAAPGLPW